MKKIQTTDQRSHSSTVPQTDLIYNERTSTSDLHASERSTVHDAAHLAVRGLPKWSHPQVPPRPPATWTPPSWTPPFSGGAHGSVYWRRQKLMSHRLDLGSRNQECFETSFSKSSARGRHCEQMYKAIFQNMLLDIGVLTKTSSIRSPKTLRTQRPINNRNTSLARSCVPPLERRLSSSNRPAKCSSSVAPPQRTQRARQCRLWA